MTTHADNAKSTDEYLSYQQVSSAYGIGLSTLYSMVRRKQIPHVRIGPRFVRFRRSELDAWLNERSVDLGAENGG
jgi:excisionase family DNA binding protein